MTRNEDNKMSTEAEEPYHQKVEQRFDKRAKAAEKPDGTVNLGKVGKSHADDGGDHKH